MSEHNNSQRSVIVSFVNWLQHYLKHVSINQFKFDLPGLRVSTHRLEIQSGKCHEYLFSRQKISTLQFSWGWLSFFIRILLKDNIRKLNISKYYWKRPNMIKFIELMQSDKTRTNRNLAMFVHKAFSQRNLHKYYHDLFYIFTQTWLPALL